MNGRGSTTALVAWGALGLSVGAAMSLLAQASVVHAVIALACVYGFGYVPGSLLLRPRDDRRSTSLATIRLIAGLLLTTVAFLLSLVFGIPWYVGPALVVVVAIAAHRWSVFTPPRPRWRVTPHGVVAAALTAILLAPVIIGSFRMAPGPFAPVYYNVDTPYFMEKVHALTHATTYPPPSLGMAGGVTPYHYGVQGLAAMLARASGLAPHHVVFLIVLPLLVMGMVAAAVVIAETLSATVPVWATLPLILVAVPTFWYPFWSDVGPAIVRTITTLQIEPVAGVTSGFERWGVTLNPGTNIGAAFITLAALAGVVASPTRGWRLPVFLIGTAMLFKAPAGVALCAGLGAFLIAAALLSKSVRPIGPGLAAAAVCIAVYVIFFFEYAASDQSVVVTPAWLFHLRDIAERGRLAGFCLDLAWLFLPAIVLFGAGRRLRGETRSSMPLLAFAVAPLLLVNVLQLIDRRPGGSVAGDWLQVLVPMTCVGHIFVVSLVGDRWASLGRAGRWAFCAAVVLATSPSVFVAGRYARILVVSPRDGHEFVDNREIAAALSVIPIDGTLIVTNDLRYPAEGFSREGRQLQIPGLFGHTAFAVNFAYEHYAFSSERRSVQQLLEGTQWSEAIDRAAAHYGWTHLLIRKDYTHPESIPLQPVFESPAYSVFRFAPRQ